MKTFNLLDYKGKHEIIQDQGIEIDSVHEIVVGTITKEEALDPIFVEEHLEACNYYGIPPYYGKDEDMLKVYK